MAKQSCSDRPEILDIALIAEWELVCRDNLVQGREAGVSRSSSQHDLYYYIPAYGPSVSAKEVGATAALSTQCLHQAKGFPGL